MTRGNDFLLSILRNWSTRDRLDDQVNDLVARKLSLEQRQYLADFGKFICGEGGLFNDIVVNLIGTEWERTPSAGFLNPPLLTEIQILDASAFAVSSNVIVDESSTHVSSWDDIDVFRDDYGVLVNDILDTLGEPEVAGPL